jgi:hypothetical protein
MENPIMGRLKNLKKADKSSFSSNNRLDGFGGASVVHERASSGVKLELQTDSDCILRFQLTEDISELCNPPQEPGSALIHKFFDGERTVNISQGFALSKVKFISDAYYYFWQAGEVEMKLNPMKDIVILKLGLAGDVVEVPERLSDDRKLILSDDSIALINYSRLNYPLRKS